MIDTVLNVTDDAFQKMVIESTKPVIVDFWAPWCGPCKMVGPILEKIAKDYSDILIVAKVNTDENQEWAGRYGVQGIPTILMMKNGNIIHRQVGALPEPMLRDAVDQFLIVCNSEK